MIMMTFERVTINDTEIDDSGVHELNVIIDNHAMYITFAENEMESCNQ